MYIIWTLNSPFATPRNLTQPKRFFFSLHFQFSFLLFFLFVLWPKKKFNKGSTFCDVYYIFIRFYVHFRRLISIYFLLFNVSFSHFFSFFFKGLFWFVLVWFVGWLIFILTIRIHVIRTSYTHIFIHFCILCSRNDLKRTHTSLSNWIDEKKRKKKSIISFVVQIFSQKCWVFVMMNVRNVLSIFI